jgi:hypothetical protein
MGQVNPLGFRRIFGKKVAGQRCRGSIVFLNGTMVIMRGEREAVMQGTWVPAVSIHALWIAVLAGGGLQTTPVAKVSSPQIPAAKTAGRPALEIQLERKLPDGSVEAVPPTHVFSSGDTIRVHVTSEFDGYLYVMDQGTSGHFSTVFPSLAAGSDNQVHRGQSYLIPSTEDGWFEVSGPAGFDVLYFLLSPETIVSPTASSFVAPGPVSSLKPRCNDAVFRARGECMDSTAGPAPLPKGASLPDPIAPIAQAASRDITVTKKKDGVTVTSDGSKTAPVIYMFRLAHN